MKTAAKKLMAVAVPVINLRKRPVAGPRTRRQDPLQETQLLIGEPVRLLRTSGAWARVEALNQLTHTAQGWRPYPGWVPVKSLAPLPSAPRWNAMVKKAAASVRLEDGRRLQLSLGTGLRVIEPNGTPMLRIELSPGVQGDIRRGDVRFIGIHRGDDETRERIVKSARQFLGEPYFWGGKSSAKLGPVCGVDCSGLVSASYNAAGAYSFPRNSRDQFLRARRTSRAELKPADLVFLSAPGEPGRIVHVMLYAGGGGVVEAAGKADGVRAITLSKRFGVPFSRIESGSVFGGRTVYFGSLL